VLLLAGRAWAGATQPGGPPPPAAQATGDLDGDGRPERVRVERAGTIEVEGPDGKSLGSIALSTKPPVIDHAQVEMTSAEKHPVAHVRIRLRGGKLWEAVLAVDKGQLQTIFAGPTGPIGDGERSVKLKVGDDGIVRYQTSPTMVRCDGEDMLFPERWDFAAQKFRPVDVDVPEGQKLRAVAQKPDTVPDAPLGLFHFVAASTDPSAEVERRADLLAAPHELEDGSAGSVWRGGAGAWVTARAAQKQHAVTAVRLHFAPGGAPRTIALVLPHKAFTVEIPKDPKGPVYAVLPAPEPAECLSLSLPQAASLAEVGIFTDADRAGGLEQLAADVAAGGAAATGAAQVLSTQGVQAARAIGKTLETAHGPGRRRLLEVLAGLGEAEAAPALGRALETAAPDERKIIIAGLARLGANGVTEAARVYADESQTPEAHADAAEVLGELAGTTVAGADAAARALIAGAGRGGPAVRGATVKALGKAGVRNNKVGGLIVADLKQALQANGTGEHGAKPADENRLADLARALGVAGAGLVDKAEAARVLVELLHARNEFDVQYKTLRALGDLGDPSAASALGEATRSKDEVLRWAATESAARLGAGARPVVLASARDQDPRVRLAALSGLGSSPGDDGVHAAEEALARDAWPMVRRAAAETLSNACSIGGVEAALEHASAGSGDEAHGADPSEEVRRAALVALGRCAPRSPAIARILRTHAQPISVRELAAALIAKSGAPGAAKALAETLDSVLGDPTADERTAGLAVACLRALARTGDTSRPILESLGAASSEQMSPAIRAAAQETIGKLCPDGASAAFKRGLVDPDPQVRRITENAQRICPK
jgi:HEAT repeat protein